MPPSIEQSAPAPKQTRRQRDEPPAEGAVRAKLPQRQAPQLSAVADEPPEGADWINEIKFDGYRLLCWLDHGKVRVVTRERPGLDRPAARRGARGQGTASGGGIGGRRTGGARQAGRIELSRAAGRVVGGQGCHAASLSVRSAASRWLGPAGLQAAGPQARAVRPQRLARHVAFQRSPCRRRRHACGARCAAWDWKASSASRWTPRIAPDAVMAG